LEGVAAGRGLGYGAAPTTAPLVATGPFMLFNQCSSSNCTTKQMPSPSNGVQTRTKSLLPEIEGSNCSNQSTSSIFETYDQVVEACCEAWNFLARDLGTIRSIATRDYAKPNNS
jgi:hypothetical protein